jgi:hypothetical protein
MDSHEKQMEQLGPGKQLAALPIDSMIAMLGSGVAKAQATLDKNAIATAIELAETVLELPKSDGSGDTIKRSLLALGFLPTFYQFTEARLELRVEMKWQVEDNVAGGLHVEGKAAVGPVAVAATVDVDHSRKFGLEASLMTHLVVTMVSVPPPQSFMEFVRGSLGNSGEELAGGPAPSEEDAGETDNGNNDAR